MVTSKFESFACWASRHSYHRPTPRMTAENSAHASAATHTLEENSSTGDASLGGAEIESKSIWNVSETCVALISIFHADTSRSQTLVEVVVHARIRHGRRNGHVGRSVCCRSVF